MVAFLPYQLQGISNSVKRRHKDLEKKIPVNKNKTGCSLITRIYVRIKVINTAMYHFR